ncbi:MAG: hypothetical protein OXG72_15820 [Acidobacteria bacterium]|nr:hypothetical protein [Acidobacteriota bacterium]
MKYAGIGSRETTPRILAQMEQLAERLAKARWTLRTGGADGADTAFENGHHAGAGTQNLEVYLPWNGYNGRQRCEEHGTIVLDAAVGKQAEAIAGKLHPAWHRCRRGARALHARNVAIIQGRNLDDDVDAVVCWTRDGEATGGTGMGIRIARERDIPVFNLFRPHGGDVHAALETMAHS